MEKGKTNNKGKTKSGFAFNIKAEHLNDMELVDLLASPDVDSPITISKIALRVLGEKQKGKLYEHCRNKKTNIVEADRVIAEINEIFEILGQDDDEIKNS